MKNVLFLCIVILCAFSAYAQHAILLSIKKNEEKTSLAGATASIITLKKTAFSDSSGLVIFKNIAAGTYQIKISYVGLEEQEITVQVPQADSAIIEVLLEEGGEHEDEVVVTATRTSRSIKDIPTRVETISGEELTEKGNMKPGDIRMML